MPVMDEQMIELIARALWEHEFGTEGVWPTNVENPDDWLDQARAAHSVIAGKVAELQDEIVELWHQTPDESRSLRECLHMTQAEYEKWANPAALAPYPKGAE